MKNLFTLFLLACALHGYAQRAEFLVIDALSNRPAEDIMVRPESGTVIKFTDAGGRVFFLESEMAGSKTLLFSGLGYKNATIEWSAQAGKTPLVVSLEPSPVSIEGVVVAADISRRRELINRLDISLRPLNNSQEVLRMVPGLFIGQHAGGGKAEQIFLRGFDIDHGTDIQLTVDGMPVNMVSHAHGQGYADLHFVIPELIERVDFSKGPYLAEKGNFSTAGWVDFRTQNTLSQSTIKLEAGQFDTYRAFGAFNLLSDAQKAKGQSAYIAAEYNFSNSFFDAPQNFNRLNIQGRWNGRIGKQTNYTIGLGHFSSDWNHSGQIPDRAVESGLIGFFGSIDPTEGGSTSRTNVNFQAVSSNNKGGVWKNQLYWSRYDFELFSNFTFFLEDPVFGDQIKQVESRQLFGYNGSYTQPHQIAGRSAEWSAGVQYRQDFSNDNELAKTTNRTTTREQIQYGDINEINASAYLREHVRLSSRWSMDAGLRLEYFRNAYTDQLENNRFGSVNTAALLPKLSLYYNPSSSLQAYWKLGKGFHSNDTRVVVPQQGREVLPAAYGSDWGLMWKPAPRLLVHPAVWYLWLDQEFVYVGDAGVVEAGGKTRRIGADLSARYQFAERWFADLDLNITQPRAIEEAPGEQYIPLAPVFTSVGGITYASPSGLAGNIRYRYMADRPANEDYSVTAKGYFVTDAQLTYAKSGFTLGLHINNLFNVRWKETQFNTESRLLDEPESVEEIHFTPGSPFFGRISLSYNF